MGIGGAIQTGLTTAFAIRDEIKKITPRLEDEVTIEVIGQPGATKQQLYFLALAAANGVLGQPPGLGILGNTISHSYGMLMAEYDAADNWVRCTIKYDMGMVAAFRARKEGDDGFGRTSVFDDLVIYRGPQCKVNGAEFFFTSEDPTVIGVPANPTSKFAPKLPFRGQPIVTPCPTTPTPQPKAITQLPPADAPLKDTGPPILSPNPKPPGDNRSRGAVLTPNPGDFPPSPSPTGGGGDFGSPASPGMGGGGDFGTPPSIPGIVSGIKLSGTAINGATPGGIGLVRGGGGGTLDDKCCFSVLALIPMVFAALSSPGTDSHMTFPAPVQGPTGG